MSSFIKSTKHPVKGRWEDAIWYDDLFGLHEYGVLFPSDLHGRQQNIPLIRKLAYDPEAVKLQTRELQSYTPALLTNKKTPMAKKMTMAAYQKTAADRASDKREAKRGIKEGSKEALAIDRRQVAAINKGRK